MNALECESGAELERADWGKVRIGDQTFFSITGYEAAGNCFWCGAPLEGKRAAKGITHYCKGHGELYRRYFEWGPASKWALQRADYRCENCGIKSGAVLGEVTSSSGYRLSWIRAVLEVHHIVPVNGAARWFHPFNIWWNLIVLCHKCHQEVHAAMRLLPKVAPPAPPVFLPLFPEFGGVKDGSAYLQG